ncbi:MAG: SlyX family protein [Pseudomonadales bacterium]
MTAAEDRIDELEIKLSFQEQVIAELNDVVTAQSSRLAALERALQQLQSRVENNGAEGADPQPEPPPPHY